MKTIHKTLTRVGTVILPFMPMAVLAADGGDFGQINTFITRISTFINNTLIPLIFGIALLVFIWGMFRFFIYGAHKDDEREKGKNLMIYALVGFVLMVSIWGIVNLVAGGLGFTGQQVQNIPTTPTR